MPLRLLLALLLLPAGLASAQNTPVDKALDATEAAQRAARASQKRVDQLDDQTRALLERYRAATWQAQQLNVYAEQLEKIQAGQAEEKASLSRQLVEMERTEREILPLMLRMLDSLERFVEIDLPFLATERRERVANLRRLMADPEANLAEKYRRLLEAYLIEADYGRSLGAERAEIDGLVVDMLRVGRVALYALTLDGQDGLYWDAAQKNWQPLARSNLREVRNGLRIARDTAAASLLVLPVPAATGVQP